MLTPSKIKNHHFEIAGKNAYRAQSVDEFFDIVADSYEQMFKENGELVKKIGLLAERVEEYKNDEDNIRAALLTAQRMADKIMKEANQKAEAQLSETAQNVKKQEEESEVKSKSIIEEAENKAALILKEAENKAADVVKQATAEAKEAEVVARDRMIKAQAGLDLIEKEADKFKRELLMLYSEHIELINKIPETEIPEVVEVAEEEIPEEPEIIPEAEPEAAEEPETEAEVEAEPVVTEEQAEEDEIEEPAEEEPADDDETGFSVEDLVNKYFDADYQPEETGDVYQKQEEPAAQAEAEDIPEEKDEEPEFEASQKQDDDNQKNGGFKFDIDSLNVKDDDDDDDDDDYYDDDDDDDDDDYYDDDDDDDDDEGFSSKFKGFFKR